MENNAGSAPERAVTASLVLDLLEWLAVKPRLYAEVIDAWRTSCPRLTVWEDATESGFVAQKRFAGEDMMVELTPRGRDHLAASRGSPPAACV